MTIAVDEVVTGVASAMKAEGKDDAVLINSCPPRSPTDRRSQSHFHADQTIRLSLCRRRDLHDLPRADEVAHVVTACKDISCDSF
jgi:hypothetical protein